MTNEEKQAWEERKQQQDTETLAVVRNIFRNQWNWTFHDFCVNTGLDENDYGMEKFRLFVEAVNCLSKFDDRILTRLFT